MYLVVITVSIALIVACFSRWQSMSRWKRSGIPGPQPHPLMGNSLELAKNGMFATFTKWSQAFGQIVGFYIGGHPQLLIADLELTRRVLIKDFASFADHHGIIKGGIHPQSGLRHWLVWAHGDQWRKIRSATSSVFTGSRIRSVEPKFQSSAIKLVDKLHQLANGQAEIDVCPIISESLLRISLSTIIGADEISLEDVNCQTMAIYRTFIDGLKLDKSLLAMMMVLFPSLTPLLYPIRWVWEEVRFQLRWSIEGIAWRLTEDIVEHRLSETKTTKRDLISNLMAARKGNHQKPWSTDKKTETEGLSRDEIISNAMMFLLGGFETTATALQYTIHNLVNHQDIQEQLRNDLMAMAKQNGGDLSVKQLEQVPLLKAVIKESLRLYPPLALFVSRVALVDYEYENMVIPKGTGIFIGLGSIHLNPDNWPEPEKFKPERFMDNDEADKMTFLTFGAGPRYCMGTAFAYNELMILVSQIVMRSRLEPGPSTEIGQIQTKETVSTLVPKNGVFCKIKPIDH